MQSGSQHFMRSLYTKVTKTNDIDITLIWMQLHVILSNFVRIFPVRNRKYLIYTIYYFVTLACSRVWLFLNRVLHRCSNSRQSIRPSTIYIKVSFSAAMITVIKHCIVTVLCIFFEYTVGPADLDLLLRSSDFDIN